jgi:protein-serine/threonine kinase
MDPNRLHLNIGGMQGNAGAGFNTDRTYQTENSRIYPTTPSTFPQPVFSPGQRPQGHNDYMNPQIQSPTGTGYTQGGGYFPASNTYQAPRAQQPMYSNQFQAQSLQQPGQPGYRGGFATNDPNSGLARQFSNQNLGSSQRQPSPFGRHPSPVPGRPRTGGAGGHLGIPSPGNVLSPSGVPIEPPEPDPEKYSNNIQKKLSGLHVFVKTFFEDNVNRARERNAR